MPSDGVPVPGSLFVYEPNKGAPVFFTVAFAFSAVAHLWQCLSGKYGTFRLIGLHAFCAVSFTLGFALRVYGANDHYIYDKEDESHTTNLIIYILMQVFIQICPPLLELSNYHVLGRIFYYLPYFSPLPANRVLATFGGLMMIVEALNSVGVSLVANPTGSAQGLGGNMILAALALQLSVVATFFILSSIFHRRCLRAGIRNRSVITPLWVLYVSMILILVRCIYRLVEHTGATGIHLGDYDLLKALTPILRYEWYFYIFEATLMFLNSVLWNVWNPGRYLPAKHNVFLSQDGKTELVSEEIPDRRTFVQKFLYYFTLGILYRRDRGGPGAEPVGQDIPDSRSVLEKFLNLFTLGLLFRRRRTSRAFTELGEYPNGERRNLVGV